MFGCVGVQAVITAMRMHSSAGVQEEGCNVLRHLINNNDLTNSIRVGDRGGLDAVGVFVWYRLVLCTAVCCRVLQGVAGCCRVLQGVAGCCRVLQSVAASHNNTDVSNSIRVTDRGGLDAVGVFVWYRVLQCAAVCCSVLQCVAECSGIS